MLPPQKSKYRIFPVPASRSVTVPSRQFPQVANFGTLD